MPLKWFGRKKKEADAEAPPPRPDEPAPAEAVAHGEAAPDVPHREAPPREPTEPPAASPAPSVPPAAAEPPKKKLSAWARLRQGLSKTRQGLANLLSLRRSLDDDFVDDLRDQLYAADFGPATVEDLIEGPDGVRQAWKSKKIETTDQVSGYLAERLKAALTRRPTALTRADAPPTIILVAGVNGTGKTTSIAKLAHRLNASGAKVILAAADTFRAAAVEQLTIWSQRIGVEIVTGAAGADPASVAFQGAQRALETGADYLIVDTAGRLHTQTNLMRELGKIRGVLEKKVPGAPHEALLVLDATTGQNAVNQAENFTAAIQVTGIILSKLDGTAKGGIVLTINNRFSIPVKFIGVGEQLEDLQEFDADRFVEALLATETAAS